MNTSASTSAPGSPRPAAPGGHPALPVRAPWAESSLAEEIRHSALLLGGALGLMGALAIALLLLTTRLGA